MKTFSKPSIIITTILLLYTIIVGGYLLWWNQHDGGLIQNWYHEYVGADGEMQGSGKWRIQEFFRSNENEVAPVHSSGMSFYSFALFFGSWVYLFSVIVIIFFGTQLSSDNPRIFQAYLIAGILIAAFFLGAFHYLGVWTSVTSG
jgi:hypothetical protein